jgi:rfaE bifunctional protein nucleotidyltransferase chain/domain
MGIMQLKILSLLELQNRSASIQEHNGTLILTNGCFDLLHVGHTRYLQSARELGTALAVAINSDESARHIKGEGRPLNSEADRAEIVAALESVDYVVVFDGDTAVDVVAAVRPAIYVKGGDYSSSPENVSFPPEGHVVRAYGGQVIVIPYVPGHSTSALIEALSGRAHTQQ